MTDLGCNVAERASEDRSRRIGRKERKVTHRTNSEVPLGGGLNPPIWVCSIRNPMRSQFLGRFVSGIAAASLSLVLSVYAQEFSVRTLRLGGGSFTTSVAQANGTFAKYGLQIQIPRSTTGGSDEVRRWLASGELDLADYGVDNAIAMVENAGVDVILVAATDSTPTELMAQPEIKSLTDLRGKTVLIDAPNTQNALALKKILSTAGLIAATDYVMKEAGGTGVRVAMMLKQKEFSATMASGQTAVQARRGGLSESGHDCKHLRTDAALRSLHAPSMGAREWRSTGSLPCRAYRSAALDHESRE